MDVGQAAKELGVSPRRVRALIQTGRVAAHKTGARWDIGDLGDRPRLRRPLSPRSRDLLARALHTRSLIGIAGHDRIRTAARIRALRTSADPARLLFDWWGGEAPSKIGFGENLVQHAVAGNDDYVREVLSLRRSEYLRSPDNLADLVAAERAIQSLTREQLADAASVPVDLVRRIERALPLDSPGGVRRILRTLGVEPTALPDMGVA